MKKFKLPLIGLLVAGLITIAFIGCKKDLKSPALTSNSSVSLGQFYIDTRVSTTTACVGTSFTVCATLYNGGDHTIADPGNKAISIYSVKDGTTIDENQTAPGTQKCWDFTEAEPGTYEFYVTFDINTNSTKNHLVTTTIYVVVSDDCSVNACASPLTLAVSGDQILLNDLTPVAYTVIYTVNNCGNYIGNYKLQGGLTAKTTLDKPNTYWSDDLGGTQIGITSDYTVKPTGQNNSVITWTNVLTPLSAGNNYFTVNFTKPINWQLDPITGNYFDYLTGEWSIKNGDVLLGGYTPRVKVFKGY